MRVERSCWKSGGGECEKSFERKELEMEVRSELGLKMRESDGVAWCVSLSQPGRALCLEQVFLEWKFEQEKEQKDIFKERLCKRGLSG